MPRQSRLTTLLGLIYLVGLLSPPVSGRPVPRKKFLQLPGMSELVPKGTLPGTPAMTAVPVMVAAVAHRDAAKKLWAACVILDEVKESSEASAWKPRTGRLLLTGQTGKEMTTALSRTRKTIGIHGLSLDANGPGNSLALAIHWATSRDSRRGPLQIWSLHERDLDTPALETSVEGFYFEDLDSDGVHELVLYPGDEGSLVVLPQVLHWEGRALKPSGQKYDSLTDRLLSDYEEVLTGYTSSGSAADPPLMVLDVALLQGRLLERTGRTDEALKAYDLATSLAPSEPGATAEQEEGRSELRLRAAEARRRADALREQLEK